MDPILHAVEAQEQTGPNRQQKCGKTIEKHVAIDLAHAEKTWNTYTVQFPSTRLHLLMEYTIVTDSGKMSGKPSQGASQAGK